MNARLPKAAAILDEFAAGGTRYLWTDAFAVMTWVGLYEDLRERRFLEQATHLVGEVHQALGVSRDPAHPTARGLRIGKRLPERGRDEPYDPQLEWERDGQYFHYLTRWMHALDRMAAAARDERYRRWAAELMRTAHRAFAYPAGAPSRMFWKMSIDLSRPLVASMGAHDPLDGLVEAASLGLERETEELACLCAERDWATNDPLGAGGLLVDALRLARLVARGHRELGALLTRVLDDAAASTAASASVIGGAAANRLAFRELGFALGLHAIEPLANFTDVSALRRFVPLAAKLEEYWLEPANQATPTWERHREINSVTLAASLAPRGALG